MHSILDKKFVMVKPEDIKMCENGNRESFEEDIKILADSIATNGIIEPLAVRKSYDGRYEIIAGNRRFRAAQMVGLRRIPCVIHIADEKNAAILSAVENLQRRDLNIFEQACAIDKLMKHYGLTQMEVSLRLGMSYSAIRNKLRILRLQKALWGRIIEAKLSQSHARMLLQLPEGKRPEALEYICENQLGVLKTQEYIDSILNPEIKTEQGSVQTKKYAIGDVRMFYNSLSKLVDVLQSAGVKATTRKVENQKYIEYKVRIDKEQPKSNKCKQLEIC